MELMMAEYLEHLMVVHWVVYLAVRTVVNSAVYWVDWMVVNSVVVMAE